MHRFSEQFPCTIETLTHAGPFPGLSNPIPSPGSTLTVTEKMWDSLETNLLRTLLSPLHKLNKKQKYNHYCILLGDWKLYEILDHGERLMAQRSSEYWQPILDSEPVTLFKKVNPPYQIQSLSIKVDVCAVYVSYIGRKVKKNSLSGKCKNTN